MQGGAFQELLRDRLNELVVVLGVIELGNAVEAVVGSRDVDDCFVWEVGVAVAAEGDVVLCKGVVYVLVPPAGVAEFNNVGERRVCVGKDALQRFFGVLQLRRHLEENRAKFFL